MMSKLPAAARKRIEGAGKAGDLFKELLAEAIKTAFVPVAHTIRIEIAPHCSGDVAAGKV